MKKLIPAIVMLLVSAVVLSTASYAWFSSSNVVTANGMNVTAEAPTSILIKKAGDTNFASSVNLGANKSLVACSSQDGVKFYAPAACEDQYGAMKYNTPISEVNNPADEDATAGWHYIEQTIVLKNTGSEAVKIYVDSLTVTNTTTIGNAVRVAILSSQKTAIPGVNPYVGDAATPAYVKVPTDTNVYGDAADGPLFAETNAVKDAKGEGTEDDVLYTFAELAAGKEVTFAETKTSATADGTTPSIVVASLEAQGEITLTIRIWIEGQDESCYSVNANKSAEITILFAADKVS